MIYLIRHGLDDERFIGGYSDVKLLPLGIRQIEESASWLMKQNFDIRKIYTSDIARAIESATIIADYLKLDLCIDQKLREQNKGLLNGMNRIQAIGEYSEYVLSKDINLRYPDGESLKDLYIRIKDLLQEITKYDNSLLVTHRGVINMIYYLTRNDCFNMDKSKYNVEHGSIHEFDTFKSKIRRIK